MASRVSTSLRAWGRALLGEDRRNAAVSWSTALVLAGIDSSSVVAMTTMPSAAAADGSRGPRRQAGAADRDGAEAEDDEQPVDRGVGQGLGGMASAAEVGLLGCHRLLHAAEVTEDLGSWSSPAPTRRVSAATLVTRSSAVTPSCCASAGTASV